MIPNTIAIPPRTFNVIPVKNRRLISSEPRKVITSPLTTLTIPRSKIKIAPNNENAKPKFALLKLEAGCCKKHRTPKTSGEAPI